MGDNDTLVTINLTLERIATQLELSNRLKKIQLTQGSDALREDALELLLQKD